jgi:hypothetical protein
MKKHIIGAVLLAVVLMVPAAASAGVEFYDPLPDTPGKFMGPHGPQHQEWHYHGPHANEDAHCDAAHDDPNAPEGVHEYCEEHHGH